ncbi:hypothetical protein FO519_008208 [Halicephalobus sp. NKZ332]|nr:hypothetical protein FO519_008208 [Halicephalobus sp. NKZ332]
MNRFTALVFPLIHEKIWSFYHSLIILISLLVTSILFGYLSFKSNSGYYVINGYFAIALLLSATVAISAFKFIKKTKFVTLEVMRAERTLLYHTAFMTFWLASARISDVIGSYFWEINEEPKWLEIALIDVYDFCLLISNPGSLLFLLYLSNTVRSEFHRTFNFFRWLKSKSKVSRLTVITLY